MIKNSLLFLPYCLAVVMGNCNPLKSSTQCPADPALATSFKDTFTKDAAPYFSVLENKGDVTFGSDGIAMTINERFDNPTIQSNFYIMFGKVEVVMKAAEGKGIVSSFYLQSDALDEIDIELFGGDPYEFQSNYFVKGETGTYNRGGYHAVSTNPLENYHTYTIDWTQDQLVWYLDHVPVRVLNYDDPKGYPQTPMQIIAGTWAGGDPSNAQGTIQWAGGQTDYSKGPFTMNIKSIIVSDYSSGKDYSYDNQSGSWKSIESDGGEIGDREQQARLEFNILSNGGSIDGGSTPSATLAPKTVEPPTPLATNGPSSHSTGSKPNPSLLRSVIDPFPTSLGVSFATAAPVPAPTATTNGGGPSSAKSANALVFVRTANTTYTTTSGTRVMTVTETPGISIITRAGAPNQVSSFPNHPITGSDSQYSSFADSKPNFAAKSSTNIGGTNIANAPFYRFMVLLFSLVFL